VSATTLVAQAPALRPEVRPFVGAVFATGPQRDLFGDAPEFGVQAALEVRPDFHLLGAFGWIPARDKYTVLDQNVTVIEYTLGLEVGFVKPLAGKWELRPFMGLGTGARAYLYRSVGLENKACVSLYGALGTEFQLGHTALRLEGRENVYCYRSPIAGVATTTRNDIGIAFGVAYHIR
jgi:hypothetical protein